MLMTTTKRQLAAHLRNCGPSAKWKRYSRTPGHGDWVRGWHIYPRKDGGFDVHEHGPYPNLVGGGNARRIPLRQYVSHLRSKGFDCYLGECNILVVKGRHVK